MEVVLTQDEQKLFTNCVAVYGLDNQLEQYAEECLEAALAVRKYFRTKKSGNQDKIEDALEDLEGEIVDTTIMSLQLKTAFVEKSIFEKIWQRKITRQIGRVKNQTQEGDGL